MDLEGYVHGEVARILDSPDTTLISLQGKLQELAQDVMQRSNTLLDIVYEQIDGGLKKRGLPPFGFWKAPASSSRSLALLGSSPRQQPLSPRRQASPTALNPRNAFLPRPAHEFSKTPGKTHYYVTRSDFLVSWNGENAEIRQGYFSDQEGNIYDTHPILLVSYSQVLKVEGYEYHPGYFQAKDNYQRGAVLLTLMDGTLVYVNDSVEEFQPKSPVDAFFTLDMNDATYSHLVSDQHVYLLDEWQVMPRWYFTDQELGNVRSVYAKYSNDIVGNDTTYPTEEIITQTAYEPK